MFKNTKPRVKTTAAVKYDPWMKPAFRMKFGLTRCPLESLQELHYIDYQKKLIHINWANSVNNDLWCNVGRRAETCFLLLLTSITVMRENHKQQFFFARKNERRRHKIKCLNRKERCHPHRIALTLKQLTGEVNNSAVVRWEILGPASHLPNT